ncbi:aspartate carbamoyltransferase [Trinickia sp. Y13]|uniref:aspartate carbamoyltransferase n=1 Tax=Trinickia sp. Y13 TaxID=2917807 RepID=UPI002405C6C2|nr:aspartate carbamoyltransferase [Trinickia sp. Y13]MDG0023795.1 aspartate carbamoyltransferase [Trinickia sp. Y13]
MKRSSIVVIAASAAVLFGAAVLAPPAIAETTARQSDVARRGSQVMPFSLTATTHVFTKTADGGIQQVLTKKRPDPKQVALIRAHLAAIAQDFAAGHFDAPEQIHGNDMPGLRALRAARQGELDIHYRDVPDGGEVAYRSRNPRLVAAIHEWFDAQVSDHGRDAMAGHQGGMMQHHGSDGSMQK